MLPNRKEFSIFQKFSQFFILSALVLFATSCEEEPVVNRNMKMDMASSKANSSPAPGDASIAEIAIESDDFTQLVAALSYVDQELDAGLVDLFLNGTDQYTVFAPTDQAFEDLYAALSTEEVEIDEITDLDAALVLDVLLYHVTTGRRAANSVVPKKNSRTIETLLEKTFAVQPDASIDAIGSEATIVAPNVSASNGIIHVIDAVLLPI